MSLNTQSLQPIINFLWTVADDVLVTTYQKGKYKDDVANDQEFVNAFKHSDNQNAKITFEDVLKRKLIDHIETNFEVFKEYNDNKEFRDFFAGTMFQLMQRDFMKFNTIK
jgi:hypothetical protein